MGHLGRRTTAPQRGKRIREKIGLLDGSRWWKAFSPRPSGLRRQKKKSFFKTKKKHKNKKKKKQKSFFF